MSRPAFGRIVALAFALVVLALAEFAARALVPVAELDRVWSIIERDSALMWRNRANLRTDFVGVPVRTDRRGFRVSAERPAPVGERRPDTARIVCLGESPTFGWGVRFEDAYPALVEKKLASRLGRGIEVVNAGMIGFSSHQGRLLLEREILALRPDIVSVPFVINDIDKYRFFYNDGGPDRGVVPAGRALTTAENLLDRSRFFQVFTRAFRQVAYRGETTDGKPMAFYRPQRLRVDLADYRENLVAIARLCRDHSITPIFLAMKVNLPVAQDVAPEVATSAAERVAAAERAIDEGRTDEAKRELDTAAGLDPTNCEIVYHRAVMARHAGDARGAEAAFAETMDCEASRCGRDALAYNIEMGRIANEEQVRFVDIAASFAGSPGVEYFRTLQRDPIHPNELGHALIADRLAEVAERVLRK
ncbi:MAG: SGNH/GDSL hydrolase family protein [Deltaproteobacteria bacterium]|nr:SGNH/GDSL hydrolase family protein [Deltaproteobacteria bacterium]